ncbi:MAG: PqqD family protein [Alistipes sp.]
MKETMKFKEGYKVRDIAGEHVVIMQGRFGSDMTRVIALNETSLLLWNELQDKEFDIDTVKQVLLDNYDVDADTAEHDAKAWIEKLEECGLV